MEKASVCLEVQVRSLQDAAEAGAFMVNSAVAEQRARRNIFGARRGLSFPVGLFRVHLRPTLGFLDRVRWGEGDSRRARRQGISVSLWSFERSSTVLHGSLYFPFFVVLNPFLAHERWDVLRGTIRSPRHLCKGQGIKG